MNSLKSVLNHCGRTHHSCRAEITSTDVYGETFVVYVSFNQHMNAFGNRVILSVTENQRRLDLVNHGWPII